MGTYAITRGDGKIDLAEGSSVEDVSWRYGWPGNGNIELYIGEGKVRHVFDSPEHQANVLNDKPDKPDKPDTKPDDKPDTKPATKPEGSN